MSACRTDVENGSDVLPDSVFLCNLDQRFQVGIYVALVLGAGIIYKNFNIRYFRKFLPDIAYDVVIMFIQYRCLLSVKSDDIMTFGKKTFGNGFADALRCACDKYFHIYGNQNSIPTPALSHDVFL